MDEDLGSIIEFYPSIDLQVGTNYFWKVIAKNNNGSILECTYNDPWPYGFFTTIPQIQDSDNLFLNRPMIDSEVVTSRTLIPEKSPYWFSQNPFTQDGTVFTILSGTVINF